MDRAMDRAMDGSTRAEMRAWTLPVPAPVGDHPLRLEALPVPAPAAEEVRLRVTACGVCRTDLHLVEGDLAPRRPGIVPGHQVVGVVDGLGERVDRFSLGDRIGIAWLRQTCGQCRWCRTGAENLCPRSAYTGWDAHGGFASYAVAPAAYCYRLPEGLTDEQTAPLLCAGIIGYRALVRADLPPGGRLGIYGFGSSAHLTAQVAIASGAEVFVMTRGRESQQLARRLGAVWVGGPMDPPPRLLDSAIVFAPAGELVPPALEALDRGGTLALAGIHMSPVPTLDYSRHLFLEKNVRSVMSNTRADGEAMLRLAGRLGLEVHVSRYAFDDVARALEDLAEGRVSGSVVMTM